MSDGVYQHFRKEEHPFIDMVNDWLEQVDNQYAPVTTDFLNPREAYILQTLVGQRDDILCAFYGGFDDAERTCSIMYPEYYVPEETDYDITLLEVIYPVKFGKLSHGKILGTLMSSGIKRELIGDIITDGSRWQVFVKSPIADYLITQTRKIGSFGVRLEPKELEEALLPINDWQLETVTLSSFRIDNLISTVYNVSRQRSKEMIESGNVKINWVETYRPDAVVSYLDIISVRKFGRIQIDETLGKSKKNKHRLAIKVFRK